MRRSQIPTTVTITVPATHAGSYRTSNRFSDVTYSWYFVGKDSAQKPHFTVGRRDEGKRSDKALVKWFRFHLTIPIAIDGAVSNGHIFYIIDGSGRVNRQRRGATNEDEMPSTEREEFKALLAASGAVYDQLAQAFYDAALAAKKAA